MKRLAIIAVALLLSLPVISQDKGNGEEVSLQREKYDYNPMGKRDPFRDLLSIRKKRERGKRAQGIRGVYTDELVLVGIARDSKGHYYAQVLDSHNFPYIIKVGTKLADGEVIKITANEVVIKQATKSPVFLKPYKYVVLKLTMEEE